MAQFGPKIRIGGTLGRAGQKLKIGAGKLLSSPVGQIAAGLLFGPAGAAGAGALGDVLDTTDGKFDVQKAGRRALLTYVGGKVVSKAAGKIGGLFKRGGGEAITATSNPALDRLADGSLPDIGTIADPAAARAATRGANPSRFRSIASSAGRFLGGDDGLGMDDVLAYGQAAEGVYDRYRRTKLEDEALAEWRRRQPLRNQAQRLLLDESRPDLSSLTADPNIRYRRVGLGG